jgi:hypothetical protein
VTNGASFTGGGIETALNVAHRRVARVLDRIDGSYATLNASDTPRVGVARRVRVVRGV